jgi:hypothetical protein
MPCGKPGSTHVRGLFLLPLLTCVVAELDRVDGIHLQPQELQREHCTLVPLSNMACMEA